jgi:CheY-like chemotaxis protein
MGSELHVRSTIGEGTTFWFDIKLPETNDDIIATTEPSRHIIGFSDLLTGTFTSEPGEVSGQATRKILIVDDQDENRQVLKEILLPLGFDIIEAIDGKNALEKASEYHPDLILIDLMMLRADGDEVTHQIRQIPELKSTIVIAISADIYELSRQNCASVGYDDFLIKPIQIDPLLKKLQHYLKINWLYESQQDVQTISQVAQLIPPPEKDLQTLFTLAMKGDIMAIHNWIKDAEGGDPKYSAFIDRIAHWTNTLEITEIQTFVEQYIHPTQPPKDTKP